MKIQRWLQDIKETKRYGRTDGSTDDVKTVYSPQTKFVGGIKIWEPKDYYIETMFYPKKTAL